MKTAWNRSIVCAGVALVAALSLSTFTQAQDDLDGALAAVLAAAGFTGKIESTLEQRLGRPIDPKLADLGRLLWFDTVGGLRSDNTCGGCHSPTNGFGDSQSIAIGIHNNNIVGKNRSGPRNQRRTPSVVNSAFYPALMWNGRFFAPTNDPFDNSEGYTFPLPEGTMSFPPNHPSISHLLIAQGHLPPTELVEVAGFTGTAGTIGPDFDQFDDGVGFPVPPPDESGFRNEPIRQVLLARLNSIPAYRELFGEVFDSVAAGGPIDFIMFTRAVAEFEFTLTMADAPIDRFARGQKEAMSVSQKWGALIFFGKGRCVECHAVSGPSNEMFSDFQNHVVGVPQIAPMFGVGLGNVVFDGPGREEDFGLEQVTGDPADRYKFRTSPLRNAALQAAFFHNGAFTTLEEAIRHHLDVFSSARSYNPVAAGLDSDLTYRMGPIEPVLARVDPRLAEPIELSLGEFNALVAFVGGGLLDERASKQHLCRLVPGSVPSGFPTMRFQNCPQRTRHDDAFE
jgi:cytochrome c peroxidase